MSYGRHAIDRAAAKPNDNGKLQTVYQLERKQEWTIQFVSTDAVVNFI